MIIGLDIHGVINSAPKTFQQFCIWAHEKEGAKIYIISGPPKSELAEELAQLSFVEGTHYDKLFSVVDHLFDIGAHMWQDEQGNWWSDDRNWWSSKAVICELQGVDIHVDDSQGYEPYFRYPNTRFVLWKRKD